MATPDWLSGVTAVVVRGDELLLVRRADTGEWSPVTGIIDPGEQPAVAARREVLEEAGVLVTVERLASVGVTSPLVYENGDQAQYLDLTFRCRWDSGDPHPADGENTEARWFTRGALPPLAPHFATRIEGALSDELTARFER
jgi:ADP-ribose pyrophosphatase YjhB (NUDIX family)